MKQFFKEHRKSIIGFFCIVLLILSVCPAVFADGETAEAASLEVSVQGNRGGILSFLYVGFGKAMSWLYNLTGNYIVTVLLLAVAIKIILFPLSIRQQKSSQKMAKLTPKTEAIRKKYAGRNDKATQMKMNEEIQQLYSDEKYNPMGGCLPLLLQFPVIIALYNAITCPLTSVLSYSDDLIAKISTFLTEHAAELEIVSKSKKVVMTQSQALSTLVKAPESIRAAFESTEGLAGKFGEMEGFYNKFSYFGDKINLMENPSFPSWLFIVSVLVLLASYFSTKIIRKFTYNPNKDQANDMSMKLMDITMPLMIFFFSFSVPAMVGLYWVFQNVVSIAQQYLLYKLFPVTEPTPEEMAEAERLYAGKPEKKKKRDYDDDSPRPSSNGGNGNGSKKKVPTRRERENSPFIYAKKGLDKAYVARMKKKGTVPKAKMKP